ncbi:hypothetical protein AHAS_Ahas08G0045800 [Arachis hypogaea]
MEVVETMIRRKINIMCLQETKWVGAKARELDTSGFKLWYTRKDVVNVKRVGDWIISIKLVVEGGAFHVINAYAPVHTLGRAVRPGMFYRQIDRPLRVRTTRPLLKEFGQATRKAQ